MSHNDNNGQYVGLRPQGCCTLLNDRVYRNEGDLHASRVLGAVICLDINVLQLIDKVSLIHHYNKVLIWFI